MEDITIQDLITEQKNRIPLLYPEYSNMGILSCYKYPDMDSYYKWLEKAKRFIEINYPDDKHIADFEQISNQYICPDQQKQLPHPALEFVDYYTMLLQLLLSAAVLQKILLPIPLLVYLIF